jgi:hypothetical protein
MKFPFTACFGLVALLPPDCTAQTNDTMNKIGKNGMTVSWKIEEEHLRIVMTAPATGWVAIGFNTADELAGTNLLMGCVINTEVMLSDRYIVAPGDHRPVSDLGGTPAARLLSGSEDEHATRIEFLLPQKASDPWHHTLQAGQTYTLLLAFSLQDDFAHHSAMRTTTTITL